MCDKSPTHINATIPQYLKKRGLSPRQFIHWISVKQQTFACHMQLWHVPDKTDACLAELCQMCFLLCYNAIKLQLKNMFTPEKHKPKQQHAQIYVTLNAMRLGIKHKVPYLLTKCHIHTRKSQTKTATCTDICYSKCHAPGHKTQSSLLTYEMPYSHQKITNQNSNMYRYVLL